MTNIKLSIFCLIIFSIPCIYTSDKHFYTDEESKDPYDQDLNISLGNDYKKNTTPNINSITIDRGSPMPTEFNGQDPKYIENIVDQKTTVEQKYELNNKEKKNTSKKSFWDFMSWCCPTR